MKFDLIFVGTGEVVLTEHGEMKLDKVDFSVKKCYPSEELQEFLYLRGGPDYERRFEDLCVSVEM